MTTNLEACARAGFELQRIYDNQNSKYILLTWDEVDQAKWVHLAERILAGDVIVGEEDVAATLLSVTGIRTMAAALGMSVTYSDGHVIDWSTQEPGV